VCTQPTHHVQLRAKDLYDVYCLWCRRNAMDPVSTNMFGRRLSDRNIHKETVQVVYYTLEFTDEGIRLFEELRRKLSRDPADNTPRDLGGGNDDK
jgi:hypothetical protein